MHSELPVLGQVYPVWFGCASYPVWGGQGYPVWGGQGQGYPVWGGPRTTKEAGTSLIMKEVSKGNQLQ